MGPRAVRPLALQTVDELGKILAHTATSVDDERHGSAYLPVRDRLGILIRLVRDAHPDDALWVSVGTVQDVVEVAADEVSHRDFSELPVPVNADARPVSATSA